MADPSPNPPETKYQFLKQSLDKMLLVGIFILLVVLVHHGDAKETVLSWMEQSATTVLGAYIGLTQSIRVPFTAQKGGNGNASTQSSISSTPSAPSNVTTTVGV